MIIGNPHMFRQVHTADVSDSEALLEAFQGAQAIGDPRRPLEAVETRWCPPKAG